MKELGSDATSLKIGSEIVVECRLLDYSSLVKCPGYDVTHIEETTFALSESEIDHLIGGVDHTGSVAASAYGFIGKGETLELLKVGLKEL